MMTYRLLSDGNFIVYTVLCYCDRPIPKQLFCLLKLGANIVCSEQTNISKTSCLARLIGGHATMISDLFQAG